MSRNQSLSIEIVSDVVCPWCFIGLRRLEQAISIVRQEHPGFRYAIRWWPFFLNPDTPPEGEPYLPFLIRKFGGQERVEDIFQRVREAGAPLGIDYQFGRIRLRVNTLQAHRLIHWAQQQGDATALMERLFVGQFERGENVSDNAVLADMAAACGYDRGQVSEYLASGRDADLIQSMEREARSWGVTAVPTFIFARAVGVQGAEAPSVLADAILQLLDSSTGE